MPYQALEEIRELTGLCQRRRGVKIGENKISQEINNLFSTTYHRFVVGLIQQRLASCRYCKREIGMSGKSTGLSVRKKREERFLKC
jgi:hypothetical protein